VLIIEMIVLLRDIGFDTQAIVRIKEDQSLDREEFLQFLVEEWGNDAAEKAAMALEALAQRRSGDAARAALEEEGKLESTVAAMIAPSVVNEKLKQLFKEWDVDHTRYIDLKGMGFHFIPHRSLRLSPSPPAVAHPLTRLTEVWG
jgi:hypothetical protein